MQGFVYFINETAGMGVPFLYPLGYQGVGQYPPQYLTALYPDALIYIAADEKLQKCWEAEPFKIDHLKPKPIFNKAYGKLSLVSTHPKLPPGESVPWKPLPPDPDQKLYPAGPAHPCMISEPKCLPGNIAGIDAEKFGDPCHGLWKMPENFQSYLERKKTEGGYDVFNAMPGQVPTPSTALPFGSRGAEPLVPDEFPQKRIVFDKTKTKKKPKLNEETNMKSFLQFWEAMKKNELAKKKNPKNMKQADDEYQAWDESKPKVMPGKKFE